MPKPKLVFTKISYERFERLMEDSTSYDETEIDGYMVCACYDDAGNCIAMYYNRAGMGSYCPQHKGCVMAYSERDTHWPYPN